MFTLSDRAELIAKAGPDASYEQRLTILEKEVDRLRERRERDQVGKRFDRVEANLTNERAERTKDYAALKEKVEDFAVGGLHLEVVGLAWLVVGVLFGTLPECSVAWVWEHGATGLVLFGGIALGWVVWKFLRPLTS